MRKVLVFYVVAKNEPEARLIGEAKVAQWKANPSDYPRGKLSHVTTKQRLFSVAYTAAGLIVSPE
jgi:hypothetical protein